MTNYELFNNFQTAKQQKLIITYAYAHTLYAYA